VGCFRRLRANKVGKALQHTIPDRKTEWGSIPKLIGTQGRRHLPSIRVQSRHHGVACDPHSAFVHDNVVNRLRERRRLADQLFGTGESVVRLRGRHAGVLLHPTTGTRTCRGAPGSCHLNRNTEAAVRAARFEIERVKIGFGGLLKLMVARPR
jgi:hypothetical protein